MTRSFPIRVESLARGGALGDDAVNPLEDGCSGGESYALMVLGEAMAPEFADGDVIIVEPDGLAADGTYVVAWWNGEWTFRQLLRDGAGWRLHCLNPAFGDERIPDLAPVRGVVIQKARPGRRRMLKRYVD